MPGVPKALIIRFSCLCLCLILTWSHRHVSKLFLTSHIPSEYFFHPFLLCKFVQHLRKRCIWPFEKSKGIALFISQISQISGNKSTSVSTDLKINNLQTLSTLLSQLGIELLRCCGEVRLFFFSHRTCFAQTMFFHNTRTSSTLPIKFYPVVLSVISATFTTLSICLYCICKYSVFAVWRHSNFTAYAYIKI